MVDVSVGGFSHGRGRGIASRLRMLIAWAGDFAEMFGAARRVANATENHRAPRAEDLAILGITSPLPRS